MGPMLALAAAVVLSQVVYSWVDEQGVTHYTDGASGLPEQAEKTELPKVSVVPSAPENLPKPEPLPPPKAAAAAAAVAGAPTPVPQAHTVHNPLPDFEYVENPPGMEGTGLYTRFDPWPVVPCVRQNVQGPCVVQPYVLPQPPQPQKPAGPELVVNPEPKLGPKVKPKPARGMVSGR